MTEDSPIHNQWSAMPGIAQSFLRQTSKRILRTLVVILGFSLTALPGSAAEGELNIVASIKPVHSLVAMVAGDNAKVTLLANGNASPHGMALTPSSARAMEEADLIVWIGPELERFLEKPLSSLDEDRVLTLMQASGVDRLALRDTDTHDDEGDSGDHSRAEGENSNLDPHIWLDTENARAMVTAISEAMVKADPEGAAIYRRNAERAAAMIGELEKEIAGRLAGLARPYVAYHDAYQYFENRFGLPSPLVVTSNPESGPGAATLREIQAAVEAGDLACVLVEPGAQRPVAALVEDSGLKSVAADPSGLALPEGQGHYAALMKDLAESYAECFS